MSDDEQKARTKRAQFLTCPCCTLTWATREVLQAHLQLTLKAVVKKLAELEVKS